jgi:hypothetical protein
MSEEQAVTVIKQEVQSPPFGMDYRDWFKFRKDLELKKSSVRSKVQKIEKNFINTDENYASTEASDVFEAIRTTMHEENLGFKTELSYDEDAQTRALHGMAKAYMKVTWTDLDSGYFETEQWLGTGADNSDKGIYKAYTGAIKYCLQMNFLLSAKNPQIESEKTPSNVVFVDDLAAAENAEFEQEMKRQEKLAADNKKKAELEYAKRQEVEEQAPVISDTGEGITSGQFEIIKEKLEEISTINGGSEKTKKAALTATVASLKGKAELRDYGARTKEVKDVDTALAMLSRSEAEFAITQLEAWAAGKKKAKDKKEKEDADKQAKLVQKEAPLPEEPKQQEANW